MAVNHHLGVFGQPDNLSLDCRTDSLIQIA
jgi:hypothetical protein